MTFVRFSCGMTQQMSEVPESSGVLETKGVSAEAYGPVLAVFV